MNVYKIRNKDGIYSTGGLTPKWKKNGKTWTSLQYVKAHLNMIDKYCERYNLKDPYKDSCYVVEYIVTEDIIFLIKRTE